MNTSHAIPHSLIASILIFGSIVGTANAAVMTFQEGVNGYTGVVDMHISTDFAGTRPNEDDMEVFMDSALNREDNPVIKFTNIFGNGAGQIPLGSTITAATLSLTLTGQPFDTSTQTSGIHRVLLDWNTTHDYTDVFWGGNGIQNNGVEAVAVEDDTGTWTVSGGTTVFNVLPSLQAWSAGADNYGWFLRDQLDVDNIAFISSSEFATAGSRPLLTVTVVPEPSSSFLFTIVCLGLGFVCKRSRL